MITSLLEVSWVLFCCFVFHHVIAIAAAPSIHCLNGFVSAGLLFLHCYFCSKLVRLTVINSLILLVCCWNYCPMPFLVMTNSKICAWSRALFGCSPGLSAVQLPLPVFVDCEQHLTGHVSPQWILACDSLVSSAHWYIWHFWLIWHLFLLYIWHFWLIWHLFLLNLVAGKLNSVGCCFGLVASFVCLLGSFVLSCFSDSGCRTGDHSFESIYWPFVGGLVGTVSNLHPYAGLLQCLPPHASTCKAKCFVIPRGSRHHGLSRGWRGSCWHAVLNPEYQIAHNQENQSYVAASIGFSLTY